MRKKTGTKHGKKRGKRPNPRSGHPAGQIWGSEQVRGQAPWEPFTAEAMTPTYDLVPSCVDQMGEESVESFAGTSSSLHSPGCVRDGSSRQRTR